MLNIRYRLELIPSLTSWFRLVCVYIYNVEYKGGY